MPKHGSMAAVTCADMLRRMEDADLTRVLPGGSTQTEHRMAMADAAALVCAAQVAHLDTMLAALRDDPRVELDPYEGDQ